MGPRQRQALLDGVVAACDQALRIEGIAHPAQRRRFGLHRSGFARESQRTFMGLTAGKRVARAEQQIATQHEHP
jgi:hypothetical protein